VWETRGGGGGSTLNSGPVRIVSFVRPPGSACMLQQSRKLASKSLLLYDLTAGCGVL
jgi:hypothetical protein